MLLFLVKLLLPDLLSHCCMLSAACICLKYHPLMSSSRIILNIIKYFITEENDCYCYYSYQQYYEGWQDLFNILKLTCNQCCNIFRLLSTQLLHFPLQDHHQRRENFETSVWNCHQKPQSQAQHWSAITFFNCKYFVIH